MPQDFPRLAIGCMTGTSLDALDIALVEQEGQGLHLRARFIAGLSRPFAANAPDLARGLRELADQTPLTAGRICALAADLADFHVEAIRELLRTTGGGVKPNLIAVHGQTVFHRPPLSWQLLNPAPIAHALKVPIVFDLRAADLAAGGQGAPITPLADWILFRSPREPVAVVNLGGFCNITFLPPGGESGDSLDREIHAITARDMCACNQLLDAVARRALGTLYDQDGSAAARGHANDEALDQLLALLWEQITSGRSLGTGDELVRWIDKWSPRLAPDDLAATATQGVGHTIGEALEEYLGVALIAGGGAKNKALMAHLDSAAVRMRPIADRGVPPDYREAAAMAVLGALCQDRVPITLPQVTHVPAPAPIAGTWMIT